MVQGDVRREVEDRRKSKAEELSQQGAWVRWELPQRSITWSDLWKMDPFRIAFLLWSVYDTIPSPCSESTTVETNGRSCMQDVWEKGHYGAHFIRVLGCTDARPVHGCMIKF